MRPVTRREKPVTNLQTDSAGAIDQNRQAQALYNSHQEWPEFLQLKWRPQSSFHTKTEPRRHNAEMYASAA